MKKILLFGRPYSNGGDFLIYDRIRRIMKDACPEAQITLNLQNDAQFAPEELNGYDAIVTGGGGAQFAEPYVRTSFFFQHFNEIKTPIHYMGTGLYGADGEDATRYEYPYSDEMIKFFNHVVERGGQLASRDWVVDEILRNSGVKGVVMAGCPAWYDLDMLAKSETDAIFHTSFANRKMKKIAVSNHGLTKNAKDHEKKISQMKGLIQFLKEKYPAAEIMLTFNDGYVTKYSKDYNLTLQKWAQEQGVKCVELSSDAAKFKALDEIDLHVGFRVHTHIYCVSKMIPSLLIEEDIRGFGMNETLCLPHITAYAQHSKPEDFVENPYLIRQLAVLLKQMETQDRIDYGGVYRIIRNCYRTGMQTWLKNLFQD